MNEEVWKEYEIRVQDLVLFAEKSGIQIAVYASDGVQRHGDLANDDKHFMCPGTILFDIAQAPRRAWGQICRFAQSIAWPEGYDSVKPSDIQAASTEIPERCAQLQCHRCGF